ncbi:MAG: DUF721 domain-containing protein [Candidatus Omnitrophica bacterium]|nr:DUF721 domain-containing protein [Candidatus Omnitrophota bacterium]
MMSKPTGQRIDALLPSVLKRVEQHHAVLDLLRRRWKRLVGPDLAAHTQPVSVRRGQLVIAAEQPGDSFMLHFQRERLAQHVRTLTEGKVTSLVVRPQTAGRHAVSH